MKLLGRVNAKQSTGSAKQKRRISQENNRRELKNMCLRENGVLKQKLNCGEFYQSTEKKGEKENKGQC